MSTSSMELEVWRSDWGLASIDFDCLRVLTYMKFIGVNVKTKDTNNPFWTPRGQLPVLRDGRLAFDNYNDIIKHLQTLHMSTDVHLDPVQVAEANAFTQYLHEKLRPAVRFTFWVDERNYSELTRASFAKGLRLPFNFYYPPRYHTEAKETIDALYGDNCDLKDVEKTVYSEAEQCLKALSERLGESEYLFGSRPCSVDAAVFAYLAPLAKAPLRSAALQGYVRGHNNLNRYVARISQKFFRQVSDEYSEQARTTASASAVGVDSKLPNETRNKVLAAIFAVVAMTGYAIATGLFQVNLREEFYRTRDYGDIFDNEEDDT